MSTSYSKIFEIESDIESCTEEIVVKDYFFAENPQVIQTKDQTSQNSISIYPNPAVITASVNYTLVEEGEIDISIYHFTGVKVKELGCSLK